MKRIAVKIILVVWIIIWAIFLVRPLFKKDLIKDYSSLSKLSTEGKRAYVIGPKLYEFIMACDRSMSKPSSYEVVGIEKDSLEHRRLRYYLYPNIETKEPEFILVYGINDYDRLGYRIFMKLDSDSYILRKTN